MRVQPHVQVIIVPDNHKYSMTLDLSALRHLGIGLYSNTPAVMSEAVANAWDADASQVDIDVKEDSMTIQDNGCGMTVNDANEKYLRVGYERRKKEGGSTRGGRQAMGRKGIGKLSLFAIANTVTIHSTKDGERHGFEMRVKDIEGAIRNEEAYHPKPVTPASDLASGTRITLSDLKHKSYAAPLRKRLARRFSIIGEIDKFAVMVNGNAIGVKDRGYCENLQYVWVFGGGSGPIIQKTNGAAIFHEEVEISLNGRAVPLKGWAGTVHSAGQLKDADTGDNMNKIAVMVRGKAAQEDILGEFSQSGVYSSYIVGEVYADFLDNNGEGEDVVTTSRQRIKEDSPGYMALKEGVRKALLIIEKKWNEMRDDDGDKRAREIPQVREWYDNLDNADHKRMAKSLFGRINRMPVGSAGERNRLIIGGVLAFESLRLRDMLDRLGDIDIANVSMLKDVFLQLDDLEASSYYQTTKSRLAVIDKLIEIADSSPIEKVVQDHLYNHLWLLDPSWERMQGTERIETTVRKAFESLESKRQKDGESRLDIKYTTTAGKHVIIELKRPSVVVDTGELITQVEKYRTEVEEIMQREGRPTEPVEFVCIVGKKPRNWSTPGSRSRSEASLAAYSARVVMYDELIRNAQETYKDYTERQKSVSRVYNLIASIDESDKEPLRPSGNSGR